MPRRENVFMQPRAEAMLALTMPRQRKSRMKSNIKKLNAAKRNPQERPHCFLYPSDNCGGDGYRHKHQQCFNSQYV